MPQISVIVPVYKVEPYLRRCVDSILCQTFSEFELILVDDGSPDACPRICDEYAEQDSRVHVIHQKNGGLSAARNAGIDWVFRNSDSGWLTFIDSDDWIHPGMLERLYAAVTDSRVAVAVCGYEETAGEEPAVASETGYRLCTPEELYTDRVVTATIACGKLYRRSLFADVRYPVGKLHEDEFTTYRLLFAVPQIVYIDAPLYFYFQNDSSIMHTKFSSRNLAIYDALENQIAFFDERGFRAAQRYATCRYINSILSRLEENSSNPEIREDLLRREKQNFRRYAKYLDYSQDMDTWTLAKIFPNRVKFYSLLCSIWNKFHI